MPTRGIVEGVTEAVCAAAKVVLPSTALMVTEVARAIYRKDLFCFMTSSHSHGLAVGAGAGAAGQSRVRCPDNQACAPTTRVSIPVSKVGRITGAKSGLWLTGSSLSRPAFLASA